MMGPYDGDGLSDSGNDAEQYSELDIQQQQSHKHDQSDEQHQQQLCADVCAKGLVHDSDYFPGVTPRVLREDAQGRGHESFAVFEQVEEQHGNDGQADDKAEGVGNSLQGLRES